MDEYRNPFNPVDPGIGTAHSGVLGKACGMRREMPEG